MRQETGRGVKQRQMGGGEEPDEGRECIQLEDSLFIVICEFAI